MLASRTLTVSIARSFAEAYTAASPPEAFPKWAAGLSSALHREGNDWVAETPTGRAVIRFSPPNPYGVLDHHVVLPGLPEIYVPLRMIANGAGTDVVFTLFRQPSMDDAAFEHDAELVRKDLAALKRFLEAG